MRIKQALSKAWVKLSGSHIGTRLLITGSAILPVSFFYEHPATLVVSCVLIYLGITMRVGKLLSSRTIHPSEHED